MKKLDKSTNTLDYLLECIEGQRVLLSSDEVSIRCPSMRLSYTEAKKRLLSQGMTPQSLDQLEGFLRGMAREIINNELHK